ncbi:Ejaculatory bulb-specific protein 3 [Blattella germanica]|nr:Ejaculatory bulb-specific protein 3 [Blattella germanica]
MQKAVAVLVLLVIAVAFSEAARIRRDDKFTTKYDNIDLDEVLKSDRLFLNYFNCLMDKGRCTPDGEELKKSVPDALENDCSKCSEKQKEGTKKVLKYLIKDKPQQWDELIAKYDPTGDYKKKYEEKYKDELQQ